MIAPDPLRQSHIGRFDACALSLRFDLENPGTSAGPLAAIGSLFHRWVARAIGIMRENGETRMGVDQGMELLLEVVAQRNVPPDEIVHLPMSEVKWLRICVTKWCQGPGFNAARVMMIEERLRAAVYVPDGEGGRYERIITGKPDVVVADPPDGVIVVDWKSGWQPPPKLGYEDSAAHGVAGTEKREKLTDQGFVQQVVYGIILLQNLPAINRVTLREAYLRHGDFREATIDRYNLERLTDVLGGVIGQLDRACEEGDGSPLWIPTAGPHCATCAKPRACPLQEFVGIPTTLEEAVLAAREWIVAAQVRKERLPFLKGWVEENGPIPIDASKGRREVGWKTWDGETPGPRGNFTLYEPEDAPDSPFDERLAELLHDA